MLTLVAAGKLERERERVRESESQRESERVKVWTIIDEGLLKALLKALQFSILIRVCLCLLQSNFGRKSSSIFITLFIQHIQLP